MTIRSSGALPASEINTELGRSASALFNMNGAEERALAGVASGSYGFNSFYGKSSSRRTSITSVGLTSKLYGPPVYGWAASGKGSYYHHEAVTDTTAFYMGSISATTGVITSGTLHSIFVTSYYNGDYHLEISSSRSSNGGWTSVTLTSSASGYGSYTFNRASANHFAQTTGSYGDPDVSGSYKWIFASDQAMATFTQYQNIHGGTNYNQTTMINLRNMFGDAWYYNYTIHCDFT